MSSRPSPEPWATPFDTFPKPLLRVSAPQFLVSETAITRLTLPAVLLHPTGKRKDYPEGLEKKDLYDQYVGLGNLRVQASVTPEERESWAEFQKETGAVDTFRALYPGAGGHFTYFNTKYSKAPKLNNKGLRLDFVIASPGLCEGLRPQTDIFPPGVDSEGSVVSVPAAASSSSSSSSSSLSPSSSSMKLESKANAAGPATKPPVLPFIHDSYVCSDHKHVSDHVAVACRMYVSK